jgi:hypothetical protein
MKKRKKKVGLEYSSTPYCSTIINTANLIEENVYGEIALQLEFLKMEACFKISDIIEGYSVMSDISVDLAEVGMENDLYSLEWYEGTLSEESE